jgi:hypothetical protein
MAQRVADAVHYMTSTCRTSVIISDCLWCVDTELLNQITEVETDTHQLRSSAGSSIFQ